ncbi:Uncharacterized [Syntrophomonas zehnderi OL-4]|uniref:Uncharacterized n=1 Tax=Syntrophomonas zehnderi OL-4 TaxID=690567 RepID=A0A0E4C8P6_9FIRM|nr:hypothetical protein [Syntrophomonas zehnderi]CFX63983.1 Uncharacterized [Syntrophomonas zehnderi OL-4]
MLNGMQDYKNTVIKKVTGGDRIDPGAFSIGETGWWLFHAAAIAGVYALGVKMGRREYE